MSTVDLLKNAKKREYMAFEDKALAILRAKVQENPIMKEKLAKLNIAQGLSESSEIIDEALTYSALAKKLKELQPMIYDNGEEVIQNTYEVLDDENNFKRVASRVYRGFIEDVFAGKDIKTLMKRIKKTGKLLWEEEGLSEEDYIMDFINLIDDIINYI